MIRFACSSCRKQFQLPLASGGACWPCPRCASRVQVPTPPPPPPPAPPKGAPASRHSPWMLAGLAGAVFLFAAVWLCCASLRWAFPPAGSVAEVRSKPRSPEEELVAAYIRNNASKAEEVELLVWGPHMMNDELDALRKEAGMTAHPSEILRWPLRTADGEAYHLLRVRYRDFHAVFFTGPDDRSTPMGDFVFAVCGKRVELIDRADGGDDWKRVFRRNLSRDYPALESH